MDPATFSQLTFVVSGLAGGALGEAGKESWDALLSIVRRLGRRESRPILAAAVGADSQIDVAGLVRVLARQADADSEFAAALREWWVAADRLVRDTDSGNVNVISGTVHGPSVQARDINGSISFGSTSPGE
jgi:hypothetical protein